MRRNPRTTLCIRTCKTYEHLEHANLLSPRCPNRNSKLGGRNKLLARFSREKPTCCFSRTVLRTNNEHCLWESWRKYVQPWSGTVRQLVQEEHRTRIDAQAKIDQQHKRKTRKGLTFTRTHRNNKLNLGNTLCKRTHEPKPGRRNPACRGKQVVEELKWRPQKSSACARWRADRAAAGIKSAGQIRSERQDKKAT
jgi:hypothetical protein